MQSKSDWPRITIVTPSYNQGQFLRETIESVLNQNYPNFEYIIIDGGSTDNSVEIIKEYEKHLAYWVSEPDKGQSGAIAKGFARSSGKILAWINSDDAYFPGALERIGRYFADHPEVDLVTAGIVYTDERGRITRCYEHPDPKMWLARRAVTYIGQQATFFRKEIYEKAGGLRLDLHFLMDTELWLRILINGGRCCALRGLVGFFRWHERMKSIRRHGRKAEEKQILIKEYNWGISDFQKNIALILYRLWQIVNGNYFLSFKETMSLQGKSIEEIWGWNHDKR